MASKNLYFVLLNFIIKLVFRNSLIIIFLFIFFYDGIQNSYASSKNDSLKIAQLLDSANARIEVLEFDKAIEFTNRAKILNQKLRFTLVLKKQQHNARA